MPIKAATEPMLFLFDAYFSDNPVKIKRITNGSMDVINSAETIEITALSKILQ